MDHGSEGAGTVAEQHAARRLYRVVIVVDDALPRWQVANIAVVLGATLGAQGIVPLGHALTDPDGDEHPAIVEATVPVLAAPAADLSGLRRAAMDRGVLVLDFNSAARDSSTYEEYARRVEETVPIVLGLAMHGPRRAVTSIVGNLKSL
ncbi:MAG TPA: DUF2000 domain-containing protein, partial [Candidatus Saccharimonadales bacterium]|nr:DUF2000 domain-containing protein [Candidatus Saccharimonadales bacterium]